jgi:prephenate dehydrogenase
MWRDVALTNRDALLTALDDFSGALDKLRGLIAAADGAGLEAYFLHCRQLRREHDRILNPLMTSDEEDVSA